MGNSFATDGKDLITFLYYVFSFGLQFIVFVVGTIYFRNSDNRQRKRDADKERLQEWRKLSQKLNLKYLEMTSDKVIQRLQRAKESSNYRISPHRNGLDVLRYMVNDEDSFPSHKELEDNPSQLRSEHRSITTALGKLRFDLNKVFVELNYCWSLCLLGEIPEIFGTEMRRIVVELGGLALPFYSEKSGEHRLKIIKECLKKFGVNPDTSEQKDRKKLTDTIPYVKFLHYEPDGKSGKLFTFKTPAAFFSSLNYDLVESSNARDYAVRFAGKLKEKKRNWIRVYATDEEMVMQLIHDVRCMACKTPPLNREETELLNAFKAVKEEVRPFLPQQEVVKGCITLFKWQLSQFEKDGHKNFPYLKEILDCLYQSLKMNICEFANGE